jgi:hypothetical protein
MKTNYAAITKFPCDEVLASALINSLDSFLQSNSPLECAEEIFVRTNLEDCDMLNKAKDYDSAWILECLPIQQFHWHSYDKNDIYFSMRRILFIADEGLTLSFFSKDSSSSNVHEQIISEGPSFMEIKFDGKTVHRFRPNQGRLFAYSFHYKDFSDSEIALASQSILYEGNIPPVTFKRNV